MMTGLLNRLRGQLRIRVECAFPERVLNLCGARDLSFWDLEWESAAAFTCRISRRDYAVLRQAAGRLGGGLLAVQWAEDGVVEALCHRRLPVWAVQWHPERLGNREPGRRLMAAFLGLV